MRMWKVAPKLMCNQHILGEHLELHMFKSAVERNSTITGFIANGLVELHHIQERHDELVEEFKARGWPSGQVHKTPIVNFSPAPAGKIDVSRNIEELAVRCYACSQRISKHRSARA